MPDIFLSYSREDQATARRYAEALQREGFKVWWDQALHPGETFDQVTEAALREARAVVVLWSRQSVASRWVRSEATQADRFGTLVPVMIEACDRPIMFELTHTEELVGWSGNTSDPRWPSFVERLRRFLERDVTTSVEQLPAGATMPPPFPNSLAPRPASRPFPVRLMLALVAALTVGGAGLGYWFHHSAQQTATNAAAEPIRILVRPFADRSPAQDRGYVAANLAGEIRTLLEQVERLRPLGDVTGRTMQGVDPTDVGRTLDVSYVVDGSVSMEGSQIRVIPELIDTSDGEVIWSHRYTREFRDSFALYEEIARDVTRQIGIRLDVSDMPRAMGGTNIPEAYDLFLRAVSGQGQPGSQASAPQTGRQAIGLLNMDLLREAVRADPQFATAWQTLLTVISVRTALVSGDEATMLLRQRESYVRQMESLKFEGWVDDAVRVDIHVLRSRWTEALAAARAAAAVAPAELIGSNLLWPLLLRVGWFDEAIPHMEAVLEADPLNRRAATLLVQALLLAGHEEEARSVAARYRSGLTPLVLQEYSDEFVRLLEFGSGANPDDLAALKKVLAAEDGQRLAQVIEIPERALDDPAILKRALRPNFDDPARRNLTALALISRLATFFGDRDLAFEAFRLSAVDFRVGSADLWAYRGVRSDPRFKEVMRELGLVDFWRSQDNWGNFCKPVDEVDFECH